MAGGDGAGGARGPSRETVTGGAAFPAALGSSREPVTGAWGPTSRPPRACRGARRRRTKRWRAPAALAVKWRAGRPSVRRAAPPSETEREEPSGRNPRRRRTRKHRRPGSFPARIRPGIRNPPLDRRRRRRYGSHRAGSAAERGGTPGPEGTGQSVRHVRRRTQGGTAAGGSGDGPHRQPFHEHGLRRRPAAERAADRTDRPRGPRPDRRLLEPHADPRWLGNRLDGPAWNPSGAGWQRRSAFLLPLPVLPALLPNRSRHARSATRT